MPKKRLLKEDVINAVAASISIRQAMIKLGYHSSSGGSGTYLYRKIREWGLDTSHMLGQRANSGVNKKGGPKKKTAADILIYHANGQRNRALQLRRGLDEIGRPYKCASCGINDWMGNKIVLEVEHKDGDFQNDREENLEYLCPNCHSQTPTYCHYKNGRLGKMENPSDLGSEFSGFESPVAYQISRM